MKTINMTIVRGSPLMTIWSDLTSRIIGETALDASKYGFGVFGCVSDSYAAVDFRETGTCGSTIVDQRRRGRYNQSKQPLRCKFRDTLRTLSSIPRQLRKSIVLPAQYSSDLPVELIVDQSAQTGRFNMSMDEALLELGGGRTTSVCRIYRWSEPTVTLGYFQATQAEQSSPFPGLPVVRRLSGGGAILHDQELTYSCVLPVEHPVRHDPSQLYGLVHEGLIQLISDCGLPCCLRSDFKPPTDHGGVQENHSSGATPSAEAFLCFLRQNPNDIVDVKTGFKIVGSAQRRRRGVILQHGSILLRASYWAPSIPGVLDLSPHFDVVRFTQLLPSVIANRIGGRSQTRAYSDDELAVSAEIGSRTGG